MLEVISDQCLQQCWAIGPDPMKMARADDLSKFISNFVLDDSSVLKKDCSVYGHQNFKMTQTKKLLLHKVMLKTF